MRNYQLSIINYQLSVKKNRESGQMLIVVLLITIVGLTVGLFLMSRTTTDVSVTTRQTDANRAFNAAEAGIEESLRDLSGVVTGTPLPLASGIYYTVQHASIGGGSTIYPATVQTPLNPGESFTVWLTSHNADGSVNMSESESYDAQHLVLCYTNEGSISDPHPAVSLTLFYLDRTVNPPNGLIEMATVGYDDDITRTPINHFRSTALGQGQCGSSYDFRALIQFNSDFDIDGANPALNLFGPNYTMLALRIQPVYQSTSIAVVPQVDDLPIQGNTIESYGTAGEASRRIKVIDPFPALPVFFDYVLYSTSGIVDLDK